MKSIMKTRDGAALLDEVELFLGRFVAFPSEAARVAVVLWAAHTHALDAFDSTPRLALLSPEPGSGKSRCLEALDLLVPSPMHALNASPAAVFRSISVPDARPVLLMDEVDAVFGRRQKGDDPAADLRALLNAGHRRGATIPRCVGPSNDVQRFEVFCAVALAGLGDLPDTVMSRSVLVRMRRRAPGEVVEPFRRRDVEPDGEALRDRLAAWLGSVADDLGKARPLMPHGVEDRDADVWEALLAVADAAGGHWPERARVSAVSLVSLLQGSERSLGVRLLSDLRVVFGGADRLSSVDVVHALNLIEEAPWSSLRGGPLDARGLARRLSEYGIESRQLRIGKWAGKGYRRADLEDSWSRYVPLGSSVIETDIYTTKEKKSGTKKQRQVIERQSVGRDASHPRGSETDETRETPKVLSRSLHRRPIAPTLRVINGGRAVNE